jgi:hypothetical protein
MNKFQRTAADVYAGGDFAYVEFIDPNAVYGDTLFTFLMSELSDNEDCEDLEEAIRRLHLAENQILTVRHALEELL